MERLLYICAAGVGLLGVALGAFGAHALKSSSSAGMLVVFETGVRYQMYHAFALFAAAWGFARWREKQFAVAGCLFIAGTVLFSGSLYALSLTGIRGFGAITPLGGVALLAGWAWLAWGALRAKT